MRAFPIRPILDQKNPGLVPYLSHQVIQETIGELATAINRDYQGQSLICIAVLKGAILFVADLIRQLSVSTEIEFVRLSSYGNKKTSTGTVTLLQDIQIDIYQRPVLILEEIIDSGRTLEFLYNRLLSAKPASLEIATLLDKPHKRAQFVPVKYVGRVIEERFLIGYGLDWEELCRNYPDIYYLTDPHS